MNCWDDCGNLFTFTYVGGPRPSPCLPVLGPRAHRAHRAHSVHGAHDPYDLIPTWPTKNLVP